MAITKTVNLKALRYSEATTLPVEEPATLYIDYEVIVDDPDDNDLPIRTHKTDKLYADSDITNEDQIVKDIFNIVFKK
jgi:hypothetical protein